MSDVSALDRLHIKYCRDTHCRIEGDAGEDCKNMDFLAGGAARKALGADPVTPEIAETEDRVTLSDRSDVRLVFDVENQPDTENENLPGGIVVRPANVVVLMYFEDGGWRVSLVNVIGPKVHRSTGNVTKRHYEVPFMRPLDVDSLTPGWLDLICRNWENHLNGL